MPTASALKTVFTLMMKTAGLIKLALFSWHRFHAKELNYIFTLKKNKIKNISPKSRNKTKSKHWIHSF